MIPKKEIRECYVLPLGFEMEVLARLSSDGTRWNVTTDLMLPPALRYWEELRFESGYLESEAEVREYIDGVVELVKGVLSGEIPPGRTVV